MEAMTTTIETSTILDRALTMHPNQMNMVLRQVQEAHHLHLLLTGVDRASTEMLMLVQFQRQIRMGVIGCHQMLSPLIHTTHHHMMFIVIQYPRIHKATRTKHIVRKRSKTHFVDLQTPTMSNYRLVTSLMILVIMVIMDQCKQVLRMFQSHPEASSYMVTEEAVLWHHHMIKSPLLRL